MAQDSEQVQDDAPEGVDDGVSGESEASEASASEDNSLETSPPTEPIGPVVTDALERIVGVLRVRGRAAAERGAKSARRRMDLYQSKRDLDKLYQKLGREVVRLVEAGEVRHPGLEKGVARVRQQEAAVTAAAEAQRTSAGAAASEVVEEESSEET